MGRPKKQTLEEEIELMHKLEQKTISALLALKLSSARGEYLRDLILILVTLNKSLEEITDELMIYFNDLLREGTNVSDT